MAGEHYNPPCCTRLIRPIGIIKALFPALNFVSSLAIAACLTPTDPVLAAAIIGGKFAIKHVPVHIRRLLRYFISTLIPFPVILN